MVCNPNYWSPHLGLSSILPWLRRQKQPVTPQKNEQLQLTVWWPISADQPCIWCCVRSDSEDGEEHSQPIYEWAKSDMKTQKSGQPLRDYTRTQFPSTPWQC